MVFAVKRTSLMYQPDEANIRPCETAKQIGKLWTVDIPDMVSLAEFAIEEGPIIIRPIIDIVRFQIEIYDEWRE